MSEESEKVNGRCGWCQKKIGKYGLPCGEPCKKWYHYSCSVLPTYAIIMYERTKRQYLCMHCVEKLNVNFESDQETIDAVIKREIQEAEEIIKDHGDEQTAQANLDMSTHPKKK